MHKAHLTEMSKYDHRETEKQYRWMIVLLSLKLSTSHRDSEAQREHETQRKDRVSHNVFSVSPPTPFNSLQLTAGTVFTLKKKEVYQP